VQIPVLVGYAVATHGPIEPRIDRPHDTGVEVLTFPNLTRVGGRIWVWARAAGYSRWRAA